MKNIVIIGMPGSGKSTVGRIISQELKLPFVETDLLISEKMGTTIPQIFAEFGEEKFREIETEISVEVSQKIGHIISTGGGTVTREANMLALKKTGVVLFLDRKPEDIVKSRLSGRPLLADGKQKIFDLYDSRIELYRKYADFTIECKKSVPFTIKNVLEIVQEIMKNENFSN